MNAAITQLIQARIITAFVRPHNSYTVWLIILAATIFVGYKRSDILRVLRTQRTSLSSQDRKTIDDQSVPAHMSELEGEPTESIALEPVEARPAVAPRAELGQGV